MSDHLPAAERLIEYLAASPSPYHAVATAAARLDGAGFARLDERAAWEPTSAGYVARGGTLVAWRRHPDAPAEQPMRIVGAHTDSPNLRIKPRPDTGAAGWRQIGVEVYGGALLNSWLDRDLGLSGRVVLRGGEVRLLAVDRPLARVPQLAIHLDRDVNDKGLVLDRQRHLVPVWGLGPTEAGGFASFVAAELGVATGDIVTWDLMLHDLTPPALLGRDRELLASARLDNLCSCATALDALTTVEASAATAVLCLFDHEEVGSNSGTGAAGPMLEAVLERLVHASGGDRTHLRRALAGSVCVSADMAHSAHPNYLDRHEPEHQPVPNGGPVLKVNASQRYATDAITAAAFVDACDRSGVPWQVFVSRNNMPCGSTIGPITATRLGVATVDVGVPQLSMHSARELCGVSDPPALA
ncbi:MAG TPA: M18 family aminopeptidase, partial [Acidimicrobiales bacterium]